jgi:hypothetical protein
MIGSSLKGAIVSGPCNMAKRLFIVLTEQACASRLAASPVTESPTLKATQALR